MPRLRSALLCLSAGLLACSLDVSAARLRVNLDVTDYERLLPMGQARVRIYKDGRIQKLAVTGASGRFNMVLDNQADYVVRVDAPGYQAKCFTVDTQGLEWEGDGRVSAVEVELRLPRLRKGTDLSYFDLPMGIARFEPASGLTRWNRAYEEQVNAQAQAIMEQYARQYAEEPGRQRPAGPLYAGFIVHGAL